MVTAPNQGAKFLLALKLFEVGRLSSGKAGALCGMGRGEFLFAARVLGAELDAGEAEVISLARQLSPWTTHCAAGYFIADNVIAAACLAVGE